MSADVSFSASVPSLLTKRTKGVTLYRPIVFGNTATPLVNPENEYTHDWSLYVRGLNSEDISYYVDRVEFKLHESFPQPLRVVRSFPFQLNEKGWGEFEVLIKIFFVDPTEKPCILHHFLRLYPMEDPFMIRHPILPPENTVITEQYDEIVFHDPSVSLHQVLTGPENEALSLKPFTAESPYGVALEAEKVRLADAKKRIISEIEKVRQKQLDLDKKISK